MKGRAIKFGDNISTDDIIPGRYAGLRSKPKELASHTFEDLRPSFRDVVREGDILVAGYNFGIGSSREHAPLVLKLCGISAILARSVGRIFFRNSYNLGLPVLICDTSPIDEGDLLNIDLKEGYIEDITKGIRIGFNPVPDIMLRILKEGGLIPYVRKYRSLRG